MSVQIKIGSPYEAKYHGTWNVRTLTVEQAAVALRNLASGKDKVAYINALILASVAGPVDLLGNGNAIQQMPYKLYRELMDKVLELNETSAEEANFTQSSPSATVP